MGDTQLVLKGNFTFGSGSSSSSGSGSSRGNGNGGFGFGDVAGDGVWVVGVWVGLVGGEGTATVGVMCRMVNEEGFDDDDDFIISAYVSLGMEAWALPGRDVASDRAC